VYSLLILILDILFMCFIGEFEKTDPNSLDQKFKAAYPTIYEGLDIIGFRTNSLSAGTTVTEDQVDSNVLKNRFIAYIEFFLLSIYLSYHFTS
jgi:hypothetical protein